MAGNTQYVMVPGSTKEPLPNAQAGANIPPHEELDVLITVRRRAELPEPPTNALHARNYLSPEEHAQRYGADPDDIEKVKEFAAAHGLTVTRTSLAERTVALHGTAEAFGDAFKVVLKTYEHPGGQYRGRTGEIAIPEALANIVTGVFGLDNRTFASPHVALGNPGERAQGGTAVQVRGYTPLEIAALYNFPAELKGSGQTIGIIELGGGFRAGELQTYFTNLGLTSPSVTTAAVANGGQNSPGTDPLAPGNPDIEVMLDIEVAGAVAPEAKIVVYFAPDASDRSFLDILSQAVNDQTNQPDVLSISWGGPESTASGQFQTNFDDVLQTAAHLGITICVAAGDNASADYPLNDPQRPWDHKNHVDFPASSPNALACGGTHITSAPGAALSEEVWHPAANVGTGGGYSVVYPRPSYQNSIPNPPHSHHGSHATQMRGVPDVAGDAAQESGYTVLCDGLNFPDATHNPPLPPIGGTSAVAPLWAGLVALLNQGLGKRCGLIQPALYALSSSSGAFQDITTGDNGGYQALLGWDACTGLGTPNGTNLLNALKQQQ